VKSLAYNYIKAALIICLSIVSFGCGNSSSNTPSTATSVSGMVFAGPASGSSVTAKNTAGAIVAGPVISGADGSYTLPIPNSDLSSDLIIEASGGKYTDEATGTPDVQLGTFSAFIEKNSLAAGTNVTVDPSSTIVRELIKGGRTKAAAETTFKDAFGYTPDCTIKPAFAGMSSASTTPQRLAGLRAAAFSQLTNTLNIPAAKQHELILALADDLSDGVLDGKKSDGTAVVTVSGTVIPEDICGKFGQAMFTFQNDSSKNKSRLTIDKLDNLVFNKVALTDSYKVEYIPGTMPAAQGKTTFQIKLTNRIGGAAATGKVITLMPTMFMPGMSHSSPADTVVETSTSGSYDCTAYYLMSSGPGMGVWELKVMIGMETATFYPAVAMTMGTTSNVKLLGISDTIGSMTGGTPSGRTYRLFNDGISGTTAKLFIAAVNDSMMMTFPAVSVGTSLTGLTVSTMAVDISTDKNVWTALTDDGNGHWSKAGLMTLPAATNLYVRLTINGEQKTTDGKALAADSSNGFQTFIVTPSGGMTM
jgi:hypothetical protein